MNSAQTLGFAPEPRAGAPLLGGTRAPRARGLVIEVVSSLEASIVDGSLALGTKLPTESEIMARFDVSRTVVREAISRLQAKRLVETRHGVGTFVLAPPATENFQLGAVDLATLADVIALLELRISLETEAAGLAALRRSESHLEAMQSMLQSFQASVKDGSNAVPSDFGFHLEVAKATGNRHFADLMTYLGTLIIPRTRLNTPLTAPEGRTKYLQLVHGEHENIFNAIRNQDPEAARAAMRTHLSNSKDRLRKSQQST
jgi:GntR family transcriptional regulator, transcriptional repressor for pyruvate dehydrogenase complex